MLFCTLSFSPTVTRRATRSSTEAKTNGDVFFKAARVNAKKI